MEPILENIELPSPSPQTVPNWNPANAPVPLEFYDNAPTPELLLDGQASYPMNAVYPGYRPSGNGEPEVEDTMTHPFPLDLPVSDSELTSLGEESDTCSVKSSGSTDRKKIAKGRHRVDKRREWGLASPVSPVPRNHDDDGAGNGPGSGRSKHVETYQYHLISPIFKDRCHFVSKDNPKFKELEGKDPEFDECRYKYFVICVGSHYWKRTRNQVIRPARAGSRRQREIQVRDRRMNVQTFYYSLTFELETMAPLKLNSYTDLLKALKTQIPMQPNPRLYSVTCATLDSPVKFTVTAHNNAAVTAAVGRDPAASVTSAAPAPAPPAAATTHRVKFHGYKEVDPFAPGNFMDNLEELSRLDAPHSSGPSGVGATQGRGPVVVTAIQCSKVDSFGNISPVHYTESRIVECSSPTAVEFLTDAAVAAAKTAGLAEREGGGAGISISMNRTEKSLQLTSTSQIFKASSAVPRASSAHRGQMSDLNRNSVNTTQSAMQTGSTFATVAGESLNTPAASMQDTSARGAGGGGTLFSAEDTPPPPPRRTMASMNKSPERYISPEILSASQSHSSGVSVDPDALSKSWTTMEDPKLLEEWTKLNTVDIMENPSNGIKERAEHFLLVSSQPHKCAFTGADGHDENMTSLKFLTSSLTDESGDTRHLYGSNTSLDMLINELWDLSKPLAVENSKDAQSDQKDWSRDVKEVVKDAKEVKSVESPAPPQPPIRRKRKKQAARSSEHLVSEMDAILRRQIADLEREISVSPLPKSLSVSPTPEHSHRQQTQDARAGYQNPDAQMNLDGQKVQAVRVSFGNNSNSQPGKLNGQRQAQIERPTSLDIHKIIGTPEERSQSYDLDALGGDEGLHFAYFRHSPTDSDFESSSVGSLSPQPRTTTDLPGHRRKKKMVMFKDENEAFEYFKVKHFDRALAQPEVVDKTMVRSWSEPPVAPPRSSSKSRTSTRMFPSESEALHYFKIKHFQPNGNRSSTLDDLDLHHRRDRDEGRSRYHSTSGDFARNREEYIEQLNQYTPRIQPAVPKRKDSSRKFQQKLMELSRLSTACGEVADQIQNDHQEYWGALTNEFKVPPAASGKSLVSEAYQKVVFNNRFAEKETEPALHSRKTPKAPEERNDGPKAVQTDLKSTGMISAAVSDNIMNIASSVNPTQISPTSPGAVVRNEIRVAVTTPTDNVIGEEEERSPRLNQGQIETQGEAAGSPGQNTVTVEVRGERIQRPNPTHGLWNTSAHDSRIHLESNNNNNRRKQPDDRFNSDHRGQIEGQNKRGVTWCDDLTSTDDDRMSDSSASVTPDRKLDPNWTPSGLPSSGNLKSIQKTHAQRKKKKKVSWSDDYNTDDDRHSSSTSLSSVFEPNATSPETSRQFSNTPSFVASSCVRTASPPFNGARLPPDVLQRNNNASWNTTEKVRAQSPSTWPRGEVGNKATHVPTNRACPVYDQLILTKPPTPNFPLVPETESSAVSFGTSGLQSNASGVPIGAPTGAMSGANLGATSALGAAASASGTDSTNQQQFDRARSSSPAGHMTQQYGPPGLAKKSLGVQRFKVAEKTPPFPVDLGDLNQNGNGSVKH